MFRRIFLNFIRRPFWTIQRALLFVVLFGFFAMSFFMNDITDSASKAYHTGMDLNVSIGSYLQQGRYQASYNGSFESYRGSVKEYTDIFEKLKQHAGITYAGMDIRTRHQSPLMIKEKGRMGFSVIVDNAVKNASDFYDAVRRSNGYVVGADMYHYGFDHYYRFEHPDDGSADRLLPTQESPFLSLTSIEEQTDLQFLALNGYRSYFSGTASGMPQKIRYGAEELTDGRCFTQEEVDNGKFVCLIPEDLVWFDKSLEYDSCKIYKVGNELTIAVCLFGPDGNLTDAKDYTFIITGTYKSKDPSDTACRVYLPQKVLLRMLDEAYDFYTSNGRKYFDLCRAVNILQPTEMLFSLDSTEDLSGFIEAVEALPQYQSGELMYYAAVSDVAEVYSGLESFARSISSIIYIFAALVVIIAAMMAILDSFYRRREIALLQSLGESAPSVTTQLVLENLIIMVVSNTIAIPLALLLTRTAAPRLISYIPSSTGQAASQLPGAQYAEIPDIDIASITGSVSVSSQQILFSILLIVTALAACAIAASLFAKRFSSRRLLNER